MKATTFMTHWLALFSACAALHAVGCATADDDRAPAPDAGAVTEAPEGDLEAQGVTCGANTCAPGTVCCDSFCGKCAPKGMECTLGCGGDGI